MRAIIILIIIVQSILQGSAWGQPYVSPEDSTTIKNQIEGFYSWYIDLIKNKRLNDDFNPSFIRLNDGMTTLNFDNYKNGLKRFKFSDDFIQTKIKDYQQCVDNLAKIPFDKFSEFKDLDDFENINCDFSNRYEWTGGMDPIRSAELLNLTRINRKKIIGAINLDHSGSASVTFKKLKGEWRVDNLTLD